MFDFIVWLKKIFFVIIVVVISRKTKPGNYVEQPPLVFDLMFEFWSIDRVEYASRLLDNNITRKRQLTVCGVVLKDMAVLRGQLWMYTLPSEWN